MEDYHSVNASDAGIVCWARAGGAEDVIPGVDQSGFNYYSYARDGFSLRTGEKIRVVTLAPSITETVAAIGGLDYVVGTDLYSNYPEEVIKRQEKGDISIVGGYTDPNYEWILKLDPTSSYATAVRGSTSPSPTSYASPGWIAWSSTMPRTSRNCTTTSGSPLRP